MGNPGGRAGAVAPEELPGRRRGTYLALRDDSLEGRARTPSSGYYGAMRYNEKELQALSRQPAELAAELGMRAPKKGSGERAGGREPGAGGRGERAGRGGRPPSLREPALCPQW